VYLCTVVHRVITSHSSHTQFFLHGSNGRKGVSENKLTW